MEGIQKKESGEREDFSKIGGVYSLVVKILHEKGLNPPTPPKEEFLEYIKKDLIHANYPFQAKNLNSSTICSYPDYTKPVMDYIWEKGLSREVCGDIMEKIIRERKAEFSPEKCQKYFYKTKDGKNVLDWTFKF